MTKKLLIIILMLFGLTVGIMNVSAQTDDQVQTVSAPLISLAPIDSSAISEVNLRPGEKNPHVKKVQEALKAIGFLPANLESTEYLGPKTKEAIINFQKDQGLPSTGFFGPATRAALKKSLQRSGVVLDENVDIACMKIEVEKRENALLSAYDAYTSKLKTAREIRKTDLLAAWSIQDPKERHTAIKTVWETYRNNVKTATTEWNQSRKTTWTQFSQDAKNCKASAVETQNLEKTEVTE